MTFFWQIIEGCVVDADDDDDAVDDDQQSMFRDVNLTMGSTQGFRDEYFYKSMVGTVTWKKFN